MPDACLPELQFVGQHLSADNFKQKISKAAAITGPSAAEVIKSSVVLADTGLTST